MNVHRLRERREQIDSDRHHDRTEDRNAGKAFAEIQNRQNNHRDIDDQVDDTEGNAGQVVNGDRHTVNPARK